MITVCSAAQNSEDFKSYRNRIKENFSRYKQQKEADFSVYRKERNKEFAVYLEKRWEDFVTFAEKKRPERKEPVKPVIYEKEPDGITRKPTELPKPDVEPLREIKKNPIEIPVPEKLNDEKDQNINFVTFSLYGTECSLKLRTPDNMTLTDGNLTEAEVAKCWKNLSEEEYSISINQFLMKKEELHLCDWAYLKMIEKAARKQFSSYNMQVVYTAYMMTQSGYDVKLAKSGMKLHLLIHPDSQVYQLSYLNIGNKNYYIVTPYKSGTPLQTYPLDFSENLAPVGMAVVGYPKFGRNTDANSVSYVSDKWKIIAPFNVSVNPDVMSFFKDYPQCDWTVYAKSELSDEFKEQVLPHFRRITDGLTQQEAVSLLLDYVQYGFAYKTDQEQFGYEKPFFVDENFFYPYNDCEDRSILFCTLVKEILHLDTVFLHYPQHLATAVCFTESVSGDFILVDKRKYVVCDPTYIGAPIGKSMPQYQNVRAKVIK